jgi:hypothetical protein
LGCSQKSYFDIFHDSRIKIEILPTGEDNKSAPEYVMDRLNEFSLKYQLEDEDTLWLLFDVERWPTKTLSSVCRQAKQKKYRLAISNPCFEVWLCLHLAELDPNDTTCKDFENRLCLILGKYNKSHLDATPFETQIFEAIEMAKVLHPKPQQNWSPTIGSHVYRIVEMIQEAIRT